MQTLIGGSFNALEAPPSAWRAIVQNFPVRREIFPATRRKIPCSVA